MNKEEFTAAIASIEKDIEEKSAWIKYMRDFLDEHPSNIEKWSNPEWVKNYLDENPLRLNGFNVCGACMADGKMGQVSKYPGKDWFTLGSVGELTLSDDGLLKCNKHGALHFKWKEYAALDALLQFKIDRSRDWQCIKCPYER